METADFSLDTFTPDLWVDESRPVATKFHTIKDYGVRVYSDIADVVCFEQKLSVTIAYVVWSNPLYLKLAYLSILSQILYTDILDVRPVIVADERLYQFASDWFSGLGVEVILVDTRHNYYSPRTDLVIRKQLNKYVVSKMPELRKDDVLVIADCDGFTFGKPMNVYEQMLDYISQSGSGPILMSRESTDISSVFLDRRKDLAKMFVNDDEYINWFCSRLDVDRTSFMKDIVNTDSWWLSCWIAFDNSKFNDESWSEFSEWAEAYSLLCDETVYLSYAYNRGYRIEDLSSAARVKYEGVTDTHDNNRFWTKESHERVGIVHPLLGDNKVNMSSQAYYDFFQDEFRVKLEAAISANTTLKNVLPQYDK